MNTTKIAVNILLTSTNNDPRESDYESDHSNVDDFIDDEIPVVYPEVTPEEVDRACQLLIDELLEKLEQSLDLGEMDIRRPRRVNPWAFELTFGQFPQYPYNFKVCVYAPWYLNNRQLKATTVEFTILDLNDRIIKHRMLDYTKDGRELEYDQVLAEIRRIALCVHDYVQEEIYRISVCECE